MKTVIGFARLAALSLLAAVAACATDSSSSPREACEELTIALCTQIYTCLSPAELVLAGYPSNEGACVARFQESLGCAAQTLDNACIGNETYHAENAAKCTTQVERLECTQLRDPGFNVYAGAPACGQVCAID